MNFAKHELAVGFYCLVVIGNNRPTVSDSIKTGNYVKFQTGEKLSVSRSKKDGLMERPGLK